jgi:hypothetical protein
MTGVEMGSEIKHMKRTAAGNTGNKLVVSLTVTVILDEPPEPGDTFELASSDGKYKKTLGIKDAQLLVAGEKLLRFDGVQFDKSYSLVHRRAKGATSHVFPATRLRDLTEKGHGPHQSKYTYATLPSQAPKKLPDKYGTRGVVAKELIEESPVLLDLEVEDPEV